MVSSWFGGLWPGILASLLSTLALDYYFIAPIYTFVIGPKDNLIVFAASALIISWLKQWLSSHGQILLIDHASPIMAVVKLSGAVPPR
jgi:K+-sensing histidine kinase KdpD